MKFTVVTLFPQIIEAFSQLGLVGQAHTRGVIKIQTVNPRTYTSDVHHTVDDKAFGGGDGMVMKVEPLLAALDQIKLDGPVKTVVLTPQGRRWSQSEACEWAKSGGHVALVCGRYAGIDQRFIALSGAEEVSLGDFVLNGGELAACAIIESVSRMVPGVLGNQLSSERDSFMAGLLECPQFTRPREVSGLPVPSPLLSGHHAQIERFEDAVALLRTACLRPDLLPEAVDLKKAFVEVEGLSDLELQSLGFKRSDLEALRARGVRRGQ